MRDGILKVVDMHCDTIGELWYSQRAGKPTTLLSNSLHIDLEKMKKGHYLLQNFAMFANLVGDIDPLEKVLHLRFSQSSGRKRENRS